MTTRSRVIVTSAPPNPNGDLHVGHLSGPFLGGDVLSRYLRQRGHDVAHVSYADDYSCYVERRGAELGRGAAETAHVFGRRIEGTLALADMVQDYFTHPLREPVHAEIVQRFFGELWSRGAFEVVELPTYHCPACERYLYEAEMRGRCQFCDAAADGFYCEECGRPQDTDGLVDPRCTRCQGEPETRTLRRITFPLERYRERLQAHYADRPVRPRLRAYLDDMFSRPLPVTTISRETAYGIPVPLEGWEGHILDTWYSGIWAYVAATVAYRGALGDAEAALRAWSDPGTRLVHFIGFDCSFSHAILWPALLMAHGDFTLPEGVVTNEFYRLEGDKFSTSRGHAVWGGELLRRIPADPLRFYLCLTGPEREQTNFSAKDFAATVNGLLARDLQHWAGTVFRLAREDFQSTVPKSDPSPPAELDATVGRLLEEVGGALEPETFSPQRAAAVLRQAIEALSADAAELAGLRAAGQEAEQQGTATTHYEARLAAHLESLALLAVAAAPLMPAFAEQTWSALRLPLADDFRQVLPWPEPGERLLAGGQAIAPAFPALFRALEP